MSAASLEDSTTWHAVPRVMFSQVDAGDGPLHARSGGVGKAAGSRRALRPPPPLATPISQVAAGGGPPGVRLRGLGEEAASPQVRRPPPSL